MITRCMRFCLLSGFVLRAFGDGGFEQCPENNLTLCSDVLAYNTERACRVDPLDTRSLYNDRSKDKVSVNVISKISGKCSKLFNMGGESYFKHHNSTVIEHSDYNAMTHYIYPAVIVGLIAVILLLFTLFGLPFLLCPCWDSKPKRRQHEAERKPRCSSVLRLCFVIFAAVLACLFLAEAVGMSVIAREDHKGLYCTIANTYERALVTGVHTGATSMEGILLLVNRTDEESKKFASLGTPPYQAVSYRRMAWAALNKAPGTALSTGYNLEKRKFIGWPWSAQEDGSVGRPIDLGLMIVLFGDGTNEALRDAMLHDNDAYYNGIAAGGSVLDDVPSEILALPKISTALEDVRNEVSEAVQQSQQDYSRVLSFYDDHHEWINPGLNSVLIISCILLPFCLLPLPVWLYDRKRARLEPKYIAPKRWAIYVRVVIVLLALLGVFVLLAGAGLVAGTALGEDAGNYLNNKYVISGEIPGIDTTSGIGRTLKDSCMAEAGGQGRLFQTTFEQEDINLESYRTLTIPDEVKATIQSSLASLYYPPVQWPPDRDSALWGQYTPQDLQIIIPSAQSETFKFIMSVDPDFTISALVSRDCPSTDTNAACTYARSRVPSTTEIHGLDWLHSLIDSLITPCADRPSYCFGTNIDHLLSTPCSDPINAIRVDQRTVYRIMPVEQDTPSVSGGLENLVACAAPENRVKLRVALWQAARFNYALDKLIRDPTESQPETLTAWEFPNYAGFTEWCGTGEACSIFLDNETIPVAYDDWAENLHDRLYHVQDQYQNASSMISMITEHMASNHWWSEFADLGTKFDTEFDCRGLRVLVIQTYDRVRSLEGDLAAVGWAWFVFGIMFWVFVVILIRWLQHRRRRKRVGDEPPPLEPLSDRSILSQEDRILTSFVFPESE